MDGQEKYRKLFNVMDKSRKGVVSYHQLCELVYDEEAAAQVRLRLQQPVPLNRSRHLSLPVAAPSLSAGLDLISYLIHWPDNDVFVRLVFIAAELNPRYTSTPRAHPRLEPTTFAPLVPVGSVAMRCSWHTTIHFYTVCGVVSVPTVSIHRRRRAGSNGPEDEGKDARHQIGAHSCGLCVLTNCCRLPQCSTTYFCTTFTCSLVRNRSGDIVDKWNPTSKVPQAGSEGEVCFFLSETCCTVVRFDMMQSYSGV